MSGQIKMMRFLYRIIIVGLLTALIITTYLAGIPGHAKKWYYQKTERKDNFITRSPQFIQEKHRKIDREWQSFFHMSQRSKRKFDQYKSRNASYKHKQSMSKGNIAKTKKYKAENYKKEKNQCIILIYTYLHKSREWYNLPMNATNDYLKQTKCKYQNCVVTYDKNYLRIADAVVFHARNMPSSDVLNQINSKFFRPKYQKWVYFTSETPKNSEFGSVPFNGLFNWTMTYKADSDLFLPYLQYRKLKVKDKRPNPNINYAEKKTGIAAWLVGNCNFEFRLNFAHLLSKFTDVFVGGGCRDQFEKNLNCTRWCDLDTLLQYKFYLSFENGICTDYITEKYWRYLEMGLVPVVLGGANYSNPKLAIPGSFIDASKFKSVKELGLYLNYLDKNDIAYNEYFKWKQKYKIWHPPKGDWPFESYFLCKLCGMLNKNLPDKVYNKLSEFWNEYTDCELPERALWKKFIPNNYNTETRFEEAEEEKRIRNAKISKDFDEDF